FSGCLTISFAESSYEEKIFATDFAVKKSCNPVNKLCFVPMSSPFAVTKALKQLYTKLDKEQDNRYDAERRKTTIAKKLLNELFFIRDYTIKRTMEQGAFFDGDDQIYNKKYIPTILSYMALNDI
ncbi:8184_t:CDS:2, partial [Scutellospora calospora]